MCASPGRHYTYNTFQYGLGLGMGYNWLRSGILNLSSGAEVGICFYTSRQDELPAWTTREATYQIDVARLRLGKKVGGFVHIGYGIRGMLGFGIDCRF